MAKPPENVVVIGAGIVGIATALWLRREGYGVCILDPASPAEAGASAGNAGLIAPHIIRPIGMPGMWRQVPRMILDPEGPLAFRAAYLPRLAPWLVRFLSSSRPSRVRAIAEALKSQLDHAWSGLEPLVAEAGAKDLVRREGIFSAFRDQAALDRSRPELELFEALGVELRQLGGSQLREQVGGIAEHYRIGLLFPNSGHTVEPQLLAKTLFKSLEAAGGQYRRLRADQIRVRSGSAVAVATSDGDVPADAVVICAGAWSRPLCRGLGFAVPLDTERGYHVTLPEPGIELKAPVLLGDAKFAVTPMSVGIRLAGTVEFGGLQAPPNEKRFQRMIALAREAFPGISTSRASTWMGFRPSLPDSLPVIGRSPNHSNVYFGFGHGHLGLTSAGVTGKALADLIGGQPPSFDLSPFRIERFRSFNRSLFTGN